LINNKKYPKPNIQYLGEQLEGAKPLPTKYLSFSFEGVDIKGELKRGEASLI